MYKLIQLLIIVIFITDNKIFGKDTPRVLLISFDGFRWNYLDRIATPNFDKLIQSGVKAKWLQDIFVTQTFPNHYSIATGLYEESHGIVTNMFYDPILHAKFSYRNSADVKNATFWGGEPIWVTSELQGRRAGTFYWVGSEAPIKGVRPTQWRNYSQDFPWTKRVDAVVDWLANKPSGKGKKADNITLALLYFPQPDHYGHVYGPESDEVTQMIGQCDNITGYLLDKLAENDLYDKVNIIITSDHGFASLSANKTIPIFPHLNVNHTEYIINYGTGAAIWPKEGYLDSVYESLSKIGPHAKVWKKEEIPSHFHYNNNQRIPPILIMPEDHWFLVNHTYDTIYMNGSHGYSNRLMDMHPFFIAHGPAFRQNYVSEPFSSVDIYPLICHIMGLTPAPNNGSLDHVKQLLRIPCGDGESYELATVFGVVIGSVLALFTLALIIVRIRQERFKEKLVYEEEGEDRKTLLHA